MRSTRARWIRERDPSESKDDHASQIRSFLFLSLFLVLYLYFFFLSPTLKHPPHFHILCLLPDLPSTHAPTTTSAPQTLNYFRSRSPSLLGSRTHAAVDHGSVLPRNS
ncbi:hypothetical protein IE53DRAFT_78045 [Violaceomyces palustris]|uniref:Uncharacterized protein n=1 Tax=Violaceomyces palustris TaxID=1673888 RepID=A0ACD0NYH0_9BASI|nr:hypothetical protein IE53DRAFT_78045 [Violaceomyces palustris]